MLDNIIPGHYSTHAQGLIILDIHNKKWNFTQCALTDEITDKNGRTQHAIRTNKPKLQNPCKIEN